MIADSWKIGKGKIQEIMREGVNLDSIMGVPAILQPRRGRKCISSELWKTVAAADEDNTDWSFPTNFCSIWQILFSLKFNFIIKISTIIILKED